MINKYLRIFLIWFGILFALSPIFITDQVVVGERLCVDGMNNINLEGMMCEKTEYKIDEMSQTKSIIVQVMMMILGLIIFGVSLSANSEKGD